MTGASGWWLYGTPGPDSDDRHIIPMALTALTSTSPMPYGYTMEPDCLKGWLELGELNEYKAKRL